MEIRQERPEDSEVIRQITKAAFEPLEHSSQTEAAIVDALRSAGALIREGLARLAQAGAKGCVVLGDPAYYRRFGFENDPDLRFEGAPAEYFMRLTLDGAAPLGNVTYHAGFDAT